MIKNNIKKTVLVFILIISMFSLYSCLSIKPNSIYIVTRKTFSSYYSGVGTYFNIKYNSNQKNAAYFANTISKYFIKEKGWILNAKGLQSKNSYTILIDTQQDTQYTFINLSIIKEAFLSSFSSDVIFSRELSFNNSVLPNRKCIINALNYKIYVHHSTILMCK